MEELALYVRDGEAYVGTELTQGGWDPDAANGGAVLALLGHCLEDVPTLVPMTVSRLTADLMRPVPIGRRMHVVPTVLREGKKIQVVSMRLLADGVEYVRATALRLRDADLGGRDGLPASSTESRPADLMSAPGASQSFRELGVGTPGFLRAVDMRRAPLLDGSGVGIWLRLEAAVVAGEPVRTTARLAVCFDFANQVGVDLHTGSVTTINPDVTAHVLRAPTSEWIAITGQTRYNHGVGRGVSYAEFSDDDGVFAVASISQLVQPRPG